MKKSKLIEKEIENKGIKHERRYERREIPKQTKQKYNKTVMER